MLRNSASTRVSSLLALLLLCACSGDDDPATTTGPDRSDVFDTEADLSGEVPSEDTSEDPQEDSTPEVGVDAEFDTATDVESDDVSGADANRDVAELEDVDGDTTPDPDTEPDTPADSSDPGPDATEDTPTDPDPDPDAPDADAPDGADSDVTTDIAADIIDDAPEDVAPDAPEDVAPDAPVDTAPDALPAPPFRDLTVGPYPSALTLFVNSALRLSDSYDSTEMYTHVAAQGYVLQAIGHVLWAARDYELPSHDELVAAAIREVDELREADDRVLSSGPAFGLPDAWDAFGDGSTNPAFTAYTWQSGMAALGVAQLARYLVETGHPDAADVRSYGVELVDYWDTRYTDVSDGGYWWYSDRASDAIAVHNTSALVAMASQLLAESGGPARLGTRPERCADLLWARMSGNPTSGYTWNYADDGYPVGRRRAEDVSHALVTTQLMRFASERGWWSRSQMRGVASTLRDTIWSGNPARLTGFVDGSSGGESEWTWSRAAAIAYAAHGDAPGGDPLVFEMARSLLFSTDLSRYDRGFDGNTGTTGILTLALLLSHTPAAFEADSTWRMTAGPDDDAVTGTPGVRFYTVEWAAPADVTFGGLELSARRATATTANLLVDLPEGYTGRVAVSLTYSANTAGTVQQWDGSRYHDLAPLTVTRDSEGSARWHRTTFELATAHRHDYQGVDGVNLLLQLTGTSPTIHMIEATPLD